MTPKRLSLMVVCCKRESTLSLAGRKRRRDVSHWISLWSESLRHPISDEDFKSVAYNWVSGLGLCCHPPRATRDHLDRLPPTSAPDICTQYQVNNLDRVSPFLSPFLTPFLFIPHLIPSLQVFLLTPNRNLLLILSLPSRPCIRRRCEVWGYAVIMP